jgi:GH24 family phage-related lysozyme (muramidase)
LENDWTLDPAIQSELSNKWYDQPEIVAELQLNPDMIRQDFTMKSNQGYLGQIKDNKGYTMTEQSIDVDIDGKKVLMPLLVPGLSNEEIASIKENKPLDSAYEKAVAHGRQRLLKGKDPFFQEGEDVYEKYFYTDDRNIVLNPDEVPIGNMGKEVKIDNESYADYVAGWEGFIPEAKKLVHPDGSTEKEYTIGFGHYGEDVKKDATITKEEALTRLDDDINKRLPEIKKAIPNFDKLSNTLRKNIVAAWFRGTLRPGQNTVKFINEGKFKEASKEFLNHEGYRNKWKPQKERLLKEDKDVSKSVATRMETFSEALVNE